MDPTHMLRQVVTARKSLAQMGPVTIPKFAQPGFLAVPVYSMNLALVSEEASSR